MPLTHHLLRMLRHCAARAQQHRTRSRLGPADEDARRAGSSRGCAGRNCALALLWVEIIKEIQHNLQRARVVVGFECVCDTDEHATLPVHLAWCAFGTRTTTTPFDCRPSMRTNWPATREPDRRQRNARAASESQKVIRNQDWATSVAQLGGASFVMPWERLENRESSLLILPLRPLTSLPAHVHIRCHFTSSPTTSTICYKVL